jgi:hypothetical protein
MRLAGLILVGVILVVGMTGCKGKEATRDGYCLLAESQVCFQKCSADNDCGTGEACCTDKLFGSLIRYCHTDCDTLCKADADCSGGKVCCLREAFYDSEMMCRLPQDCVKGCNADEGCSEDTVCCTNLKPSRCLAATDCPTACSTNDDCGDAEEGMTCCSTIPEVFAKSVCRPSASCPRTCKASTDCDTGAGEVCCGGLCSVWCPKACAQAVDCNTATGETCCRSALSKPTFIKLSSFQ